uniref:G-protein coupled receptors family 2 profile 2 domain-containing protein n=1 Tax=Stomoxys calcitrans TaxID=35570 RepID=A0A1I8NS24_STOCA
MEYFCYFILSIVVLFSSSSVLAEKTVEKCQFKDTVDLSDLLPLDNGSYIYHNVTIPKTKVATYNYTLGFGYVRHQAKSHLRGCVCGISQKCVKLCCKHGQYYNEETFECEKVPLHLNKPEDIDIAMEGGGNIKNVNIFKYFVPQVGKPCKYLESLTMEDDIWELQENGEIRVDISGRHEYLDTLNYCLSPYRYEGSNVNVLVPLVCPEKYEESIGFTATNYAMAISVLFLIPVVLIYLSVQELRENMQGKIMICYLVALMGGYSILSIINISELVFSPVECAFLGFSAYFCLIGSFLWLGVLYFDIWRNSYDFAEKILRKRFIIYSLYAWGIAALLTGLTMWAQLTKIVPKIYKPGVGYNFCWIDTFKWAATIYYYGPYAAITIWNFATLLLLCLRRKQSETSGLAVPILFFTLGFLWTLDIVSYCLRDLHYADNLFMVTDVCFALQGVWMFMILVLRPRILAAIKKR